jgi:hypothetical protein
MKEAASVILSLDQFAGGNVRLCPNGSAQKVGQNPLHEIERGLWSGAGAAGHNVKFIVRKPVDFSLLHIHVDLLPCLGGGRSPPGGWTPRHRETVHWRRDLDHERQHDPRRSCEKLASRGSVTSIAEAIERPS